MSRTRKIIYDTVAWLSDQSMKCISDISQFMYQYILHIIRLAFISDSICLRLKTTDQSPTRWGLSQPTGYYFDRRLKISTDHCLARPLHTRQASDRQNTELLQHKWNATCRYRSHLRRRRPKNAANQDTLNVHAYWMFLMPKQ